MKHYPTDHDVERILQGLNPAEKQAALGAVAAVRRAADHVPNPRTSSQERFLTRPDIPDVPAHGTPDEQIAAMRARAKARQAGDVVPTQGRSGQFIKLDATTGGLTVGRNQLPVPVPAKWIVDAFSMRHGYKWWEGGKPTKTDDTPALYDPKPRLTANAQMQDRNAGAPGWGEFRSWVMMMLDEGDFEGMQCTLDLGTVTGISAMDRLIVQAYHQLSAGSYEVNPVVEMSIDTTEMSIKQDNRKRTFFVPVFKIVGWNKPGSTHITWLNAGGADDLGDFS